MKEIPPEAMARLLAYRWPGNIRELKHAIERAVIVGDSGALRPEDFRSLPPGVVPTRGSGRPRATEAGGISSPWRGRPSESCLERKGGNISRAAAELGLTRAALYRRIRKHGLQ